MLTGQRILVTGGARGLGEATAKAAVAAGARVVLADVREQQGQAMAKALRDAGGDAHFVSVDLADPASISACVEAAVECLGGLDGLVNNAAVTDSGGKGCEEIEIDVFDNVMQVNVRGTWLMTRAALPYLKTGKAARIVNMASDTALWGAPNLLAYVASKGAVIAMTRSLARELGSQGITVNAVAPGLVEVEATAHVPQTRHQQYHDGRALQRAQLPADVCGVVMFLLSSASGFMTGQLLPVNGGFVFN